ncbi:membrane progestin receptor epsilon [Perognathus longimembris pacificus]|uniref:membrane progestin receptor epsilon n=1 Tax=Perognathus longimembris pacificus TaxID=214514 RepID=UPI002018726F|nr:membrane progestin receptor epsilon [Perognathus longimembris pacificus]
MARRPQPRARPEEPEEPQPGPGPAPPPGARRSPPLLRWDEVPEDLVEGFILSGYRRLPCTARECLASVLAPTNETLNFWTHFVPLLLFAGRFGRLLLRGLPPGGEDEADGAGGAGGGDALPAGHPALRPLWCYASGVLLTLAASCAAHVFSCLSRRLRAACFYLDYACISYYGFGSTVAYHHYLLPGLRLLDARELAAAARRRLGWSPDCARLLAAYRALVLPAAFALALACTAACCRSRRPRARRPPALRTLVFALPLSMAGPIALEAWLFDLGARQPALCRRFHRRYLWLLAAAFVNLTKIPERLRPGRFDVVGHSHQLFHLLTALSIYEQAQYVEDGLRRALRAPAPHAPAPTLAATAGAMLLLALCLGLVVRAFLAREAPAAVEGPGPGGPRRGQ